MASPLTSGPSEPPGGLDSVMAFLQAGGPVVLILLGRPLYLMAEVWWILFLAFLAGMVAAWYGQSRRNRLDRSDGNTD